MAQQGSPPRRSVRLSENGRSGRSRAAGRPGRGERDRPGRDRPGRQDPDLFEDTGDDLPPWAGLSVHPVGPGRKPIRPPGFDAGLPDDGDDPDGSGDGQPGRSRVAAGRQRRSRQRIYAWVIGAAVVVLAVASVIWLISRPKPVRPGSFVNALQHGEFTAAPNACRAVSPGTLNQYLPDSSARKVIQSISTSAQSQCSFTVDARPLFRVLEVTVQAYQPSALAPGNGSATENASNAYFQTQARLQNPPGKSHLPKAVISPLTRMGQAAFSAVQVFRSGRDTSDLVTVTARDRNTVVTVTLQGLATRGGRYGPVSVPVLQAGAVAAARDVLARAGAEPTA
ncbi:MAG: hypothetical protein ACLPUO_02595 [Streptosporangiaceae bacterium]